MQTFTFLEVLSILIGVIGGLALFLFGMEQMTDALKSFAGASLKKIMARFTSNRIKGVLTGTFVTGVIQSSSVTTVLVVGFISVGLITLPQAISIILGAHIGTTVTVQLIAFKINEFALFLIASGFVLKFFAKKDKLKYFGLMLLGFGLIFFGITLMGESTYPLREYKPFVDIMQQMSNPLIGILTATLFTSIVQSSASTIGIVIALSSQGFIPLEAGIALVFGANIGTCVTALLASIGTSRLGKQAALSHIIINIIGVLIWLPFIQQLAGLVTSVSPSFAELEGMSRQAAEAPRQIANVHTIFNLINTLLFLPLITPLEKLISLLLPVSKVTAEKETQPKYLDESYLKTPQLALDRVRLELGRQGRRVLRMLKEMPEAINSGDKLKLKAIKDMDNDVDAIHEFILSYLGKLSKEKLTAEDSKLMQAYLASANYIENMGDVIETNLISQGKDRVKSNLEFSEEYLVMMQPLYEMVDWSVNQAINSIVDNSEITAQKIIDAKPEISALRNQIFDYISSRLSVEKNLSLTEFRLQSDIIENLMRIYYQAKRIAHVILFISSEKSAKKYKYVQEEISFED